MVADLLCYLRLHTELALRAKGMLMMRENGFDVPVDEATRAKFAEMRYLRRSIGRTGLMALQPMLPPDAQGTVAAAHARRAGLRRRLGMARHAAPAFHCAGFHPFASQLATTSQSGPRSNISPNWNDPGRFTRSSSIHWRAESKSSWLSAADTFFSKITLA